jgi:hypothetical protein
VCPIESAMNIDKCDIDASITRDIIQAEEGQELSAVALSYSLERGARCYHVEFNIIWAVANPAKVRVCRDPIYARLCAEAEECEEVRGLSAEMKGGFKQRSADGRVEVQGYICTKATGGSSEFGMEFLEPGSLCLFLVPVLIGALTVFRKGRKHRGGKGRRAENREERRGETEERRGESRAETAWDIRDSRDLSGRFAFQAVRHMWWSA